MLALLVPAGCDADSPRGGDCDSGKVSLESGLVYEDIRCGRGVFARSGMVVTLEYTGTLEDGTEFESSEDTGRPYQFVLGGGQAIRGWDIGVSGMKVGGIRKLEIPAELGYGEQPRDSIPPNSTLIFEVELLDAQRV